MDAQHTRYRISCGKSIRSVTLPFDRCCLDDVLDQQQNNCDLELNSVDSIPSPIIKLSSQEGVKTIEVKIRIENNGSIESLV
jgi:hypothetical protein